MATEVISTIRSSGGDYTSLSAWEAGEQGDLVTADEIRTAECYNDWPSGLSNTVVIDGSTTDSTRYLVIRAAAGHRHDGTPGTGFWIFSSNAAVSVIDVRDPYTQIDGIDARVTSTSSGFARGIYFNSGSSNSSATGCLARSQAASGTAIQAVSAAASISVRNSLAYGSQTGITVAATTHAVDNCVVANCGTGFSASAAALVRNSVAYNNTTNWSGSWSASSTHNATSSGSDDAPGGSSVTGVSSSDFVDAANKDFHLASGATLIGAGTNLYSDFQTDIDGDTWPSSGAWDIGFDYRVSAGSSWDAALTESASATDTATASFVIDASVAIVESANAADAATAAATVVASLLESASATDLVAATLVAAAAIVEAAAGTDTASASFSAAGTVGVVETANATDTINAAATLLRTIVETSNATDAATAAATVVAMLTETAVATDTVTAAAPGTWNVSITELAAAVDVVAAYLEGAALVRDPAALRLTGRGHPITLTLGAARRALGNILKPNP